MKFDFRQSNPVGIILFFVTIGGLIGALAMGRLVAQNDFLKISAIFGAAVGIGVFLLLGRNIWLLIPLCWPLTGKINILPIPFNVQELAVGSALLFYLILVVFKKPLNKPHTGVLEIWLAANLVWMLSVYLRNPVGFRAFGTDMLGGRPYFEVLVACAAFWVITRTIMSPRQARFFPILMAAGSLIVSVIGILTTIFPRITPLIIPFYSGVDATAYQREIIYGGRSADEVGRLTMLRGFGIQIESVMTALFRPLSLLNPVNILPFIFFIGGYVAIFLSGFRGALIGTGIGFVLASYFWGGVKDAGRAMFLAFAAIVLLVTAQSTGLSLPKSAQRALSFLPGDWDQAAVRDAEGTTEWRLDMWKVILDNREKYLKNPIIGSGFGFAASDLNFQLSEFYNISGPSAGSGFENQLVTGAFHNGPLSTVRFVGIIGLILYYGLAITLLINCLHLVQQTKTTPYFYLAVFLAVPAVYGIFSYTFVYGAFDTALQDSIFTCGILRCTSESHKAWLKGKPSVTQKTNKPEITPDILPVSNLAHPN